MLQIQVYCVALSNIGRVYFCHDLGVSGSSSQTEAYIRFIVRVNLKLVQWCSGYVGIFITILIQRVIGSSPIFSFLFCFFFCLFVYQLYLFSWQPAKGRC